MTMGYIKVCWPESQVLMSLTDGDREDYGIELGEDCSYFVPEEDYDEILELADRRLTDSLLESRASEYPWDYGKHFE